MSPEVIIITGGAGDASKIAEIFFPDDGTSCLLPELPDDRYDHTQDGILLCGGDNIAKKTCITLNTTDGTWTTSHDLLKPRRYHSSWKVNDGVILMGGELGNSEWPGNSSELARLDGSVEETFSLIGEIRLTVLSLFSKNVT